MGTVNVDYNYTYGKNNIPVGYDYSYGPIFSFSVLDPHDLLLNFSFGNSTYSIGAGSAGFMWEGQSTMGMAL